MKKIIRNNKIIILLLILGIIGIGYNSNLRNFFTREQFSNELSVEYEIPLTSDLTTFSSVWNTTLTSTGSSDLSQVMLPLISGGNYDFMLDWGDGTPLFHYTSYSVTDHTHKYVSLGVHIINLTGTIQGWSFNNGGDKLKLLEIRQWGNLEVGDGGGYFYGCNNLQITAIDAMNLTLTTNFDSAFRGCDSLGTTGDFNSWNVKSITSMSYTFSSSDSFNQSLNKWEVPSVTDMSYMFYFSYDFDGNISNWDVSSVTDMSNMFRSARNFSGDISSWDVSSVTDMSSMFQEASAFNGVLDSWDVSSVTDMSNMFTYASSFDQPLNSWDVSSVTDMQWMFHQAYTFNQPLNNWDVSSVINMIRMFQYATAFNGFIDGWDASSVTNMAYMFWGASAFDQTLDSWDVSSVTFMYCMFTGAVSFNQPLNSWDVTNVTTMAHMFSTASSFNQPLNNWDVSNVTDMTNMFYDAKDFNRDIGSWDVSHVTLMTRLFSGASSFNQPLNSWDVSSVTDMSFMFWGASAFDQALDGWDVSSVDDMNHMFFNASSFNQPLNSWDVSSVTSMSYMFNRASSFNQPLSSWVVSSVTDMAYMLNQATSFNQTLNSWDVSSVQYMQYMFTGASSFNQPLNNWDVTSATTMAAMFLGAVLFNQPLNNWDVSNVAIMNNMLVGVTLDSEYYDNLLIAWSMLTLQPGVNFHAGNSRYTNVGISARGSIISTYSWIITDLGYHPTPFTSELSSDADAPDDDGSFSLTWTDSYGATNYTVYQYNSLITEINGSLTILLTETASLSLSLIDLANGTYYYAIFSNNEFGSTLSNCIEVEVLTYLYITITNPSGSSEWGLDTAQTMTWNSEGDIANVRIELYKGEAFVMEIISNTANDGEFIWSVPNSLTYADNYRIKIIDASDSDTYDYSENFEIGTAPEEPKKVPGYNLPILIGTIGIMAALLSLKRKKR